MSNLNIDSLSVPQSIHLYGFKFGVYTFTYLFIHPCVPFIKTLTSSDMWMRSAFPEFLTVYYLYLKVCYHNKPGGPALLKFKVLFLC